jgi:hypothetical protein
MTLTGVTDGPLLSGLSTSAGADTLVLSRVSAPVDASP